MIILYSKKINTNFKETIQNYLNTVNFGHLECPNCHSHDLIRWGSYERGIIYFVNKQLLMVKSDTMKIQRVRCNKCGKTHALLPIGIIPYKQITTELMNSILLYIIDNSLEKAAEKFPFNYLYLKKIFIEFKKIHFSRLATFLKSRNFQHLILSISESLDLQIQYIVNYGCCFMQIKMGCLGV